MPVRKPFGWVGEDKDGNTVYGPVSPVVRHPSAPSYPQTTSVVKKPNPRHKRPDYRANLAQRKQQRAPTVPTITRGHKVGMFKGPSKTPGGTTSAKVIKASM